MIVRWKWIAHQFSSRNTIANRLTIKEIATPETQTDLVVGTRITEEVTVEVSKGSSILRAQNRKSNCGRIGTRIHKIGLITAKTNEAKNFQTSNVKMELKEPLCGLIAEIHLVSYMTNSKVVSWNLKFQTHELPIEILYQVEFLSEHSDYKFFIILVLIYEDCILENNTVQYFNTG